MRVYGQDRVIDCLRRTHASRRLASSYLFLGPAGVGKCTVARYFARILLCRAVPPDAFHECGRCDSCLAWTPDGHPDLDYISLPANESSLKVSQFIGDREHRHREGLCNRIALKPSLGPRRVAIIDDADDLNLESANCLLKTLEEPPPNSVLILIGTSREKQLPTIRSRCQFIRFQPLSTEIVAQLLVETDVVDDAAAADALAAQSGGSLQRATLLADSEFQEFRGQLLRGLLDLEKRAPELADEIREFVAAAGRQATARRARLKALVEAVVQFDRGHLRGAVAAGSAAQGTGDDHDRAAQLLQIDILASRIDRSLKALEALERNANQATLIDCWLDELAQAR